MTNRKPRSRKIHRRAGPSVHGSPWGDGMAKKPVVSTPKNQALWLYGHHAVTAALANRLRRCHRLVATRQALEALDTQGQTREANHLPPATTASRDEVAALLTDGAVHQGVALEVSPLAATARAQACRLRALA